MTYWKPLESAPKDGTEILAFIVEDPGYFEHYIKIYYAKDVKNWLNSEHDTGWVNAEIRESFETHEIVGWIDMPKFIDPKYQALGEGLFPPPWAPLPENEEKTKAFVLGQKVQLQNGYEEQK